MPNLVAHFSAVRSFTSSRSYSSKEPRTPIIIRPAGVEESMPSLVYILVTRRRSAGAVITDGARDPLGYKLMSKVLEEVAAEFPGRTAAAAQAGPWVEVVGASGSIACIEDLTSVESVNRETLRKFKEFGGVK